MDNTTEIKSVELMHITNGKGFMSNELNYDGQKNYYTLLFAVSEILCNFCSGLNMNEDNCKKTP